MPDLSRFVAPKAVALVGASANANSFGGRCLSNLLANGYAGHVFPVNPQRREIAGLPCYQSLDDIPEAVDHVGIVVPATQVVPVLRQAEALRVPFATIFSSGFAEAGTPQGLALQKQLAEFLKTSRIRVMGPNCNGIINSLNHFVLTSTAAASSASPAGDIAIVAQSGGLAQATVLWRTRQMGLHVGLQVSLRQ